MQFSIFINQARAVEWGLNAQQTLLFAYLYSVPSWATPVRVDGLVYYRLDKAKVISDLPILTDKADTVYRLLRQLVEAGLIGMVVSDNRSVVRLTERALDWNHAQIVPPCPVLQPAETSTDDHGLGSDNFPSGSEKNPSEVGKKSELGSEKNPTYSSLYINNPIIKLNTNSQGTYQDSPCEVCDVPAGGDLFASDDANQSEQPLEMPPEKKSVKPGYPDWFEKLWEKFPPRTGSNDKRKAFHCANARLTEGKTADDLLAAVDRYARFVRADGNWGSRFVLQAQTFFGPGGHIENPWSFSNDFNPQSARPPKESAVERAFRHAAEICADADAIENHQRAMGPDDADVWPAMDEQPGRRQSG